MFGAYQLAEVATEAALCKVGGVAVHWNSEDLFSDYEQGFKVAGGEVLPGVFSVFFVCVRADEFLDFEVFFEGCDGLESGHSCGCFVPNPGVKVGRKVEIAVLYNAISDYNYYGYICSIVN